jgi:hypothetical protein
VNALRTIYHITRADFLERVRRSSFLFTLGAAVYLGYAVNANILMVRLEQYRGLLNSAWVGSVTTLWITSFLTLVGFYLVTNTLERDRQTGVGQIIAATPLKNIQYILGKTLSNVTVFTVMLAILAIAACIMQLLGGESPVIEFSTLLAPFVFCALPALILVSALAVFFETVPWLRGSVGNVFYLFLLLYFQSSHPAANSGKISDWMGNELIKNSMINDLNKISHDYTGGFLITIVSPKNALKTFDWQGVDWNSDFILGRMLLVGIAFGICFLSLIFFCRFDPAREKKIRLVTSKRSLNKNITERLTLPSAKPEAHGISFQQILASAEMKFSLVKMIREEMRLMLKGLPWWWYAVAFGLLTAGFFSPLPVARNIILPITWIWPLPLWSSMGNREARFHTDQLLFSSPGALNRQLPAIWFAGVLVALLTGAGICLRFLMNGNWADTAAWTAGALFIPSLALAFGVLSRGGRLFEVVYIILWYLGPLHAEQVPILDFMGITDISIKAGMPLIYLVLTLLLLVAAVIGRQQQLQV